MNRKFSALQVPGYLFAIGGLAFAMLVALLTVNGSGANHDSIACNDDVPAGYTCVPLVNKPQSGPGVTTPAIGELLYQYVSANTLRIARYGHSRARARLTWGLITSSV